jgi:hypothetical protein
VPIRVRPHIDPAAEHRAKIAARAEAIKARVRSVELPDTRPQREIDPNALLNYRLAGAHRKTGDAIQSEISAEVNEERRSRKPYFRTAPIQQWF